MPTATDLSDRIGPDRIGPYRILEPLGGRGTAATYKGEADRGRLVAIKLFSPRLLEDPAALERFHRDAQILAQLNHPNLVRVLESGQDNGVPYLVMEYCGGTSLDAVLKQRRLGIQEAFAVFRGICRGLAHVHQHGVVHRHLKPREILVSPDLSEVKLADFGLGRVETLGATSGTLNTGAVTLGALYYLAPEQVENRADGALQPDHRSDLYAAGVIFHEMLTGRTPSGRFALPSQINTDLPPEADVLVMKCLSRNPLQRYATALDLLADLAKLEEVLRLRLVTQIRGLTQASGGKRRALLIAGLVVLLAALAAIGLLVLK